MVSLDDYLASIEAGLKAGRMRYESAISVVSQPKPSRYRLESRLYAEPQNDHSVESTFGSKAIAPTPQQVQRPTGARRPNDSRELFDSNKFVKRTLESSPELQQASLSSRQSGQRWQPLPYALAGRIGGTPRELSYQVTTQPESSENRKYHRAKRGSHYGFKPAETVAAQPRQPSHALAQAYPKPKGSRGNPTDVYVLLTEMCGRDYQKAKDELHRMLPAHSARATSTARGKRRMPAVPSISGTSRRPSSSSHPGIVMSASATAAEEVEKSGWKPVLQDLPNIRECGTQDYATLQPTPDAAADCRLAMAQSANSSAGTRTSGQQYYQSGSAVGNTDPAIDQGADTGTLQRSWSASDLQVNSRTARDAVVRALSGTLGYVAKQERSRADGSSQREFSHIGKGLSTTARSGSDSRTRLGWQKAPQSRPHGNSGTVSYTREGQHAAHAGAASRPYAHGAPEPYHGMSDLAAMGLVPLLPLIAGQGLSSYNHPSSIRPTIKRIQVVEEDVELAAGMGAGPSMAGRESSHFRENSPGPAAQRARTLLSESRIGSVSLRPMSSSSADLEKAQAVSRPRVPTTVRYAVRLQAASPPHAVTAIPSRSSTATKGAARELTHSLGEPRTADLSPNGSGATVSYQQRQPVPPSSRSAAKEILDRRDRRDLHHRPRPPSNGKRRPSRLAQVAAVSGSAVVPAATDTASATAAHSRATPLPPPPPVSQTRVSSRPPPPSSSYGSDLPPTKAKRKPSLPPSESGVPPPPKLKRKPSMPVLPVYPHERDGLPPAPPTLKRKPTAPPGYLYIAVEESISSQVKHVPPASPATLTRTLRHADGRGTPAQTSPSSTADVPSPLQMWMEEAPKQKYPASGGVKSSAATSRQSMAPPPPTKPAAPSRPTTEVHDGSGEDTQDDIAAPTDDSEDDERMDARKPFAAYANPQRRAMGWPRMSIRRLTPRASAMLRAGDGSQSPASPWTTGAGSEFGDDSFAWGKLVRQNNTGSIPSGGEPLLDDGARAVVLHNMPFGSSGAEVPPVPGTHDVQQESGRRLRGRSSWSEASYSSIVGSTASVMDANGLWQAPQDVWLHGGLDSDGSSESENGD